MFRLTMQYFIYTATFPYIGILVVFMKKGIQFFQKSDWGKSRLDIKFVYMLCYINYVTFYNSTQLN